MISLKCEFCGGTMTVLPGNKEAVCDYCGAKALIELAKGEKDTFHIIRAKVEEDRQEEPIFYTEILHTANGQPIHVSYAYREEKNGYEMFVTKKNVLFVFDKVSDAKMYCQMAGRITYPSEQMEKLFGHYFPKVIMEYPLVGDQYLVGIEKIDKAAPLKLAGKLESRHMAWILSRLENLSCVMEYNGLDMHIEYSELFVDAKNHQILLYEGWQNATEGENARCMLSDNRKIGRDVLNKDETLKRSLKEFLDSVPKSSAQADFAYWDKCLDLAYTTRSFTTLDVSEKKLFEGRYV